MTKLEKLYMAALKDSARGHRRLAEKHGWDKKLHPEVRKGIMRRSRSWAEYQLKEARVGPMQSANRTHAHDLKKFVDSYLETALWASTDDNQEPLDDKYDTADFTKEAIKAARRDAEGFIRENRADLNSVGDYGQHGHDFFLTRNGHGAGFWDRGYGAVGDRLSKACKLYGGADIIVNDRGKLVFT